MYFAVALLGAAPSLAAQAADTTRKPMAEMEDYAMSGWKELDAFHMVMMQTWHPAKGKNDLKPIREKAQDLAAKAEKWSKSAFPKACDTPAMRTAVTKTAQQSLELARITAKGTDEELKAALKGVHDTFEVVEHGCKP